MNFSYYIGNRLTFKGKKSFSRLILRIGIAGISISIAVMIGSVAILSGFKNEITAKIIGFGTHVQVHTLDISEVFDGTPISKNGDYTARIKQLPGVKKVQVYAYKAGVIKTDTEVEGLVLKGVDKDYDWSFLQQCIVAGKIPNLKDTVVSQEILLSKVIADKLSLKVGDKAPLIFFQEPVRFRGLTVSGIFETGLEDYDKKFALADIRQIQKLNGWGDSMVHGLEVNLQDFGTMDEMAERIDELLPPEIKAYTAKQLKPQIFDWLSLLDTNVVIIMALMILVASINMITALLVLIIERTNMIGILKALGSSNAGIQKIFIYKAAYLIVQGLAIGNFVGIGFCLYQQYTQAIKLDSASYYLSVVPVNLEWLPIVLINIGAFVVCIIALLLPSLMVSRISPVKAIRFD